MVVVLFQVFYLLPRWVGGGVHGEGLFRVLPWDQVTCCINGMMAARIYLYSLQRGKGRFFLLFESGLLPCKWTRMNFWNPSSVYPSSKHWFIENRGKGWKIHKGEILGGVFLSSSRFGNWLPLKLTNPLLCLGGLWRWPQLTGHSRLSPLLRFIVGPIMYNFT